MGLGPGKIQDTHRGAKEGRTKLTNLQKEVPSRTLGTHRKTRCHPNTTSSLGKEEKKKKKRRTT